MNETLARTEITASDGSSAALKAGPSGEALETRDRNGELLFRYDSEAKQAVLTIPGGGLEIRCVDGRVELVCTRGLSIRSEGTIEIEGDRGVRLESGESDLSVHPGEVCLSAPVARANVSEAQVHCGKLEQVVERVVAWARQMYTRVEELCHTRAGRVRFEAEKGFLVQSDQARIQSKGDVHVQGRTVNLG